MKFSYKAIILFALISLFYHNAFASNKAGSTPKTIKFHKPETDAEKALDLILRVENGLIKDSKLKHEDMFTRGFDKDYERQEKQALESQECKDEGGIYCCFSCHVKKIVTAGDGRDVYYFASKTKLKGKLSHWTNCKDGKDKCVISTQGGEYYMKKEGGKWKIDGFNAGEYDGDLKVNVDYSDQNYH